MRDSPVLLRCGSRHVRRRINPQASAFTLLELLVVVAVIALLLAILLPALSRAREQARCVLCQTHLKEITRGWRGYLDSSKGQFPVGLNLNVNYGGRQGEGDVQFGKDPDQPIIKPLNRYMNLRAVLRQGSEVFSCPSDTGLLGVRPTAFAYYGTSYYPNDILIGRMLWPVYGIPCEETWMKLAGNPWTWPPVEGMLDEVCESRAADPARLLLVGDFSWYDHWDPAVPERFPYWHQVRGKHNLAFMDGHVSYTLIRKGIYVGGDYTTIPFAKLRPEFTACQAEMFPE